MRKFRTAAVALAAAGVGLAMAPVANANAATSTLNGCATVTGNKICLNVGGGTYLTASASITDLAGGMDRDVRVQNLRVQTHGSDPTWVTQATVKDFDGWKPTTDSVSLKKAGCGQGKARALVLVSWRHAGKVAYTTFVTSAKSVSWCE